MSTGLGTSKTMTGLTMTNKRVMASTDDSTPQLDVGTQIRMNDGRTYRYMKANEAIVIGQIVRPLLAEAAATVSSYTASATTVTFPGATFTSLRYNGPREEFYLYANTNTGFGQVRRIVSNTATVATIDAAFTVAVDNTTTTDVVSPYMVQLTSAAAQQVKGVALSSVSLNQWGWFQQTGYCPQIRCVGSTDPTAIHRLITSSSTAGACKGFTAAGVTAAEAESMFGYALSVYTQADTAGRGVHAILHCK